MRQDATKAQRQAIIDAIRAGQEPKCVAKRLRLPVEAVEAVLSRWIASETAWLRKAWPVGIGSSRGGGPRRKSYQPSIQEYSLSNLPPGVQLMVDSLNKCDDE